MNTPSGTDRLIASTIVTLALVGILAALARIVFLEDLATLVETRFQSAGNPLASERLDQMRQFDSRFAQHRITTLLHLVLGIGLLVLAPLQFHRTFRERRIWLHRWTGRLLILTTLMVVPSGLFFGVLMPIGGLGEVVASALFGGFCVFAVVRAFAAIRMGQVALHREWMIRAFAVVFGISTIRLVAPALELTLGSVGYDTPTVFALSLWCGWLLTLGVAELWIRSARRRLWVRALSDGAA